MNRRESEWSVKTQPSARFAVDWLCGTDIDYDMYIVNADWLF